MDISLKEDLRLWRREQAIAILGQQKVRKWGAMLFMSDEIVQRIVDCAHNGKIRTAEHIAKETRWRGDYIDQCAVSLLNVIAAHSPPPPPPPPLPPATTVAPAPALRVLTLLAENEPCTGALAKRVTKCSACKGLGHTSTFTPQYIYTFTDKTLPRAKRKLSCQYTQ